MSNFASRGMVRFATIPMTQPGAQHLFLPAPGSAGVREALFDGVFGL